VITTSRDGVLTIHWFRFDGRIKRTLWYRAWLHFIVHYYMHEHTRVHVNVSLPLLGSCLQQWTFSFLWVPELSLASATSFSQQQLTRLNCSCPLQLLAGSFLHDLDKASVGKIFPHCTPERHPPHPPWDARTQAPAMLPAQRSAS
jgi:hypothetical protein